ncbi:hypothetical protein WJX81_002385 [Elliptochloris bilobata]|uniref:Complex 1 LYR protein domain-containing protein n=1 Tax=Elliptochloris bilobata TaxID=381761 RepID=A0AAW1QZM7_9CHLO
MASRPLAVYRLLLRSVNKAFRNDDEMLLKSAQEIRSRYQAAASETDPAAVARLCAEGEEAADFIRTYVVQARLNERGNYAMQVEEHHADTIAEEAALRPPRQ